MFTMSERKLKVLEDMHLPKIGLLSHPYFQPVTREEISKVMGTSIFDRIHITTSYRYVTEKAHSVSWHSITHSKK